MKSKNQCVYCGVKKSLVADGSYSYCKDCLFSILLTQQEHIRGLNKNIKNLNQLVDQLKKTNDDQLLFQSEVLVKKLNGGEKN